MGYTLPITGSRRKTPKKSKRNDTASTSTDESISTDQLEQIIDNLKSYRFKSSTKKVYFCIWWKFNEFFIKLDRKPNNWEDRITLFVGYLTGQKMQSQTVRSYVSALKAILADINMRLDPDRFLLTALKTY